MHPNWREGKVAMRNTTFSSQKVGGLLGFHLLSLLTRSGDAEAPWLYRDLAQVWLVLDEHDIAI